MSETLEAEVVDPAAAAAAEATAAAAEQKVSEALAIAPTRPGAVQIRVGDRGLSFDNASELHRMATAFVQGGVCPAGATTGGVMASMLKGMALGLDAITSVTSISIIKGRTQMSGALILGLLKRNGIKYRFGWEGTPEENNLKAWVQAWDPSVGEVQGAWPRHEFGWGDAIRAGLVGKKGEIYKAWPKEMLLWRAVSTMGRQQFPDVCAGIYVPGEIPGDPTPGAEEPAPSTPPAPPPAPDPLLAELAKRRAAGERPVEPAADPAPKAEGEASSTVAQAQVSPVTAAAPAAAPVADPVVEGARQPPTVPDAPPFPSHAEADAAIAAADKPACEHPSIQKNLKNSKSGKAIACPDCDELVKPELRLS